MIPALLLTHYNPVFILLSFGFFRFFDILKPWPISHFDESMENAHGVMLDDMVAAVYAAGLLYVVQALIAAL